MATLPNHGPRIGNCDACDTSVSQQGLGEAFPYPVIPEDHREVSEPFQRILGREVLELADAERESLAAKVFHYQRTNGFPFPRVTRSQIADAFRLLRKADAKSLERVLTKPSMVGLKVANAFSPAIWLGKVRGKSPLECYLDDRTLLQGLRRAPQMWKARPCWNARSIRLLAGLLNRGRLSNFRPTVARALIDKYSPVGGSVLDFSSGYGGRLLGAISLKRHYIGIEPSTLQVEGLRRLHDETAGLRDGSAELLHGGAEELMSSVPSRSCDMVLTSPPYFKLERYSPEETQVHVRYANFSAWRTGFVEEVAGQSERLLRDGGHVVLNVANVPGHPVADVFFETMNSIFGLPINELELTLSSNPNRKRLGRLHTVERVGVWRK